MKYISLILAMALHVGCSSGVIVHDPARGAELIVTFLSSIKTAAGIEMAYEWTDDRLKQEMTSNEFGQAMESLRKLNAGADISLTGYETFGAREEMVIYADSATGSGRLHFRFSLAGSKHKDYYLLSYDLSDTGFDTRGIYNEYEEPIIVTGI